MVHAWSNYVRFAWGFDELDPVKKRGSSSAIFGFANIGATIVDSLDTLYVMRMVKEFEAAREWVANHLNFNQVCVCTYICVCCVSAGVFGENMCVGIQFMHMLVCWCDCGCVDSYMSVTECHQHRCLQACACSSIILQACHLHNIPLLPTVKECVCVRVQHSLLGRLAQCLCPHQR